MALPTVHVAHLLIDAKRAGHAVPDEVQRRLLGRDADVVLMTLFVVNADHPCIAVIAQDLSSVAMSWSGDVACSSRYPEHGVRRIVA
jgi:hypothetical protein